LRQVLTGLPVSGFTGSLAYRFDTGPADARGRVRAKTGTLTGVHGLAGVVDDVSDGRMSFVVVADQVKPRKELAAQTLVDRIAGALGACTCGVGSSP
jgi:D-alanyl-D-alanine carboxypeptidase/D-alanyl-D-alanine-endopeptidase (penicillin-binding protein 4)